MRAVLHWSRHRIAFAHRPFAGGLGAALYVAYGDTDPGQSNIVYRNTAAVRPGSRIARGGRVAAGTKTTAAAIVKSPTNQFSYTLPANKIGWFQVRTHDQDIENPVISGARRWQTDAQGSLLVNLTGDGSLLGIEKRDGGGFRFRFVWNQPSDGDAPVDFILRKTAGPTAVSDATTSYADGQRYYDVIVSGLQDGGAYTFTLSARNGSSEVLLQGNNGTQIDVVADATGPPAPTNVTAEER
ncbi:MAG: fibronectin type III domain-containing protein [Planctomycetes bacterium]|nr:fibronectin type III domain-containing protein [Planctomycetota bacterium]